MRRLWYYYLYLLIVWGSFRYFVRWPEVIDELWFKPMIWLTPLFWWQLSLPIKIHMFGGRRLLSVGLGVLVGVVYFALIRRFDFGGVKWSADLIGVAATTAVTEELTFSGFAAGYLEKLRKGRWQNPVFVGVMVTVLRLPLLLFVRNLGPIEVIGVLFFAGSAGMINAWIRIRTGNVTGSVLARLGMNLAVLG